MASQPIRIAVKRLNRQLTGDLDPVGGRSLRPVANVTGWYGSDANEQAGGAWGWLQLSPVAVVVDEGDGREHRLEIVDTTAAALRGLAVCSLVATLACWLTMLWSWRKRRKARKGGHE